MGFLACREYICDAAKEGREYDAPPRQAQCRCAFCFGLHRPIRSENCKFDAILHRNAAKGQPIDIGDFASEGLRSLNFLVKTFSFSLIFCMQKSFIAGYDNDRIHRKERAQFQPRSPSDEGPLAAMTTNMPDNSAQRRYEIAETI